MKKLTIIILTFVMCLKSKDVNALRLPGPQVFVVTPSPRPLQIDEGKSAPFYYQNWMRRMDTASPSTTTMTAAPKVETPDLIFAEFESDGQMQKSIRKLLEKEKITPKTTTITTSRPIYVSDEESTKVTRIVNYGLPVKSDEDVEEHNEYAMPGSESDIIKGQGPVYLPPMTTTTTTPKITTTPPVNIENIWHIIDSEKFNQQPGNWEEILLNNNDDDKVYNTKQNPNDITLEHNSEEQVHDEGDNNDDDKIDENFALPGFGTNPGSGAENESRAIRTEPNMRFPYINLKPFQMKTMKKPSSSSKKNNMFSLDNFYELKEPVRGEAQDISSVSQQIDRYNPAQPYLPKQQYGGYSKQSSPVSTPVRATANLVPPPPPPPPKISGDDFPAPASYESFPPYPPSSASFPSAPAPAPKPKAPSVNPLIAPSIEVPDDSDSSDDGDGDDNTVMDLGYKYKPPSAPVPQFIPTAPTPVKFDGYSYNKPSMTADMGPPVADKPSFQGYQYNKPEPAPTSDGKPDDSQGYHYSKPDVPQFFDNKPSSYGAHPSYGDHDSHDSDYPELIFNKPHGDVKGGGDMKGGDDMKGDDMGMMPPPAPADMKPAYGASMDDHGFPSDFPGDLKFNHDFDDHDHDHYHYHHTTTTTTEMPRVNRYSYYYLGKKLYYLPLYFSVYFIVYVGALIIKAVLRHKIVYPNSWRPNTMTASYFSKRSVDYLSDNDNLHEITGRVTHAIATAAGKYMGNTSKTK